MADLTSIVDRERLQMAVDAAQTLVSIAGPLQFLTAEHRDAEVDAAHQLAIRVEDLAGVILSVLGDNAADLDDDRYRLLGPELSRRHKTEPAHG